MTTHLSTQKDQESSRSITAPRIAILGIQGTLPASYGGFETFAEELSVRLVKRGADVTVFCEDVTERNHMDSYKGVRLIHVRTPKLGPLKTLIFDLCCLIKARKRYDVVYMLGYGSSIFCIIPRLWGTSVWINMDGLEWKRSKWSFIARLWLRLMESVALRIANHTIADADEIKLDLIRRHTQMGSSSVIPYGAPVIMRQPGANLLQQWNLLPGNYYLVVCRLEPENHVLEIIQGLQLARTNCPLIIVGNDHAPGRYVEELKRTACAKTRFIGAVYDKEKLRSLRYHSRAYLHGHSVGGTNPSLLEAMGCGNLIIAHDNPFTREVAGDLAMYFGSPEDAARIIEEVEGMSDDVRHQLARRAKERINARYTWDAVANTYFSLLQALPSTNEASFAREL